MIAIGNLAGGVAPRSTTLGGIRVLQLMKRDAGRSVQDIESLISSRRALRCKCIVESCSVQPALRWRIMELILAPSRPAVLFARIGKVPEGEARGRARPGLPCVATVSLAKSC
jgi:hypothetical protein